MVQQVTRGIKIEVKQNFEGTFYKNHKIHFAFGYVVTIENRSKDTVQLNSRHWTILDSLNKNENVDGEGVIGKKTCPQSWRYTCLQLWVFIIISFWIHERSLQDD